MQAFLHLKNFTDKPTPALKVFIFLSWVLAVVFMFGLPLWSKLFNDTLGYGKALCHHDASHIICGNTKEPYLSIAERLDRVQPAHYWSGNLTQWAWAINKHQLGNETYWGCSCGEGVFGDWACVVQMDPRDVIEGQDAFSSHVFSISYFITTPSATGLFAAVTFFPILFIWNFGAGNIKEYNGCVGEVCNSYFLFVTQVMFQIFFGLFLFFNVCAFPGSHTVVVMMFILSEVLHMIAVAAHIGCKKKRGMLVTGMCILGTVGPAIGMAMSRFPPFEDGNWFKQNAFYLGESVGLTCITGIPVILTVFFPQKDERQFEESAEEYSDECAEEDVE